jgi:hypothetical protein
MKNAAPRPGRGSVIAGLTRQSILLNESCEDGWMDARVKPAHDGAYEG